MAILPSTGNKSGLIYLFIVYIAPYADTQIAADLIHDLVSQAETVTLSSKANHALTCAIYLTSHLQYVSCPT